jgi:cytochrome c biogenesis protein|tara:strand:+ start:4468 stop:5775 length:1308 start_codon:yes stop_codon:yes gene_type:complete
MKLLKIPKLLKIFTDLKFAISILILIALGSSLGSIIEQDEPLFFYQNSYPLDKPIYGFINWKLITVFEIDHIYRAWWFLSLLIILGICLVSCTITRQFPLFINSKEYLFKKEKKSFQNLPFFVRIQSLFYLKETIILKLQSLNFHLYQNKNLVYGYRGLIGRISPILVHFSLIIILGGASIGAFLNFKAQEVLPKGELFHIQNPIKVGWLTNLPNLNIRVNDFWVEYEKNKIHQFYSNLSILDNYGSEIKEQTISVNNPLRYRSIDIYQSDWNLLGIRVKKINENKIYEFPLFSLKKDTKAWITWVETSKQNYTLIFDQLQNVFLVYDENGSFLFLKNIGDFIDSDSIVLDILPSTGLLIKYDPSIIVIYVGFGLLMLTTSLSYLPYTQIWVFNQTKNSWIGGMTNRGKIQLEIEFENLIRYIEKANIKKLNKLD